MTATQHVRAVANSMGVMLTDRECEVVSLYMRVNRTSDFRVAITQCYPMHVKAVRRR